MHECVRSRERARAGVNGQTRTDPELLTRSPNPEPRQSASCARQCENDHRTPRLSLALTHAAMEKRLFNNRGKNNLKMSRVILDRSVMFEISSSLLLALFICKSLWINGLSINGLFTPKFVYLEMQAHAKSFAFRSVPKLKFGEF